MEEELSSTMHHMHILCFFGPQSPLPCLYPFLQVAASSVLLLTDSRPVFQDSATKAFTSAVDDKDSRLGALQTILTAVFSATVPLAAIIFRSLLSLLQTGVHSSRRCGVVQVVITVLLLVFLVWPAIRDFVGKV